MQAGECWDFQVPQSTIAKNADEIPHLQLLWSVFHDRRPYICTVASDNFYSPCDRHKAQAASLQAVVLCFLKTND